MFNEQFKAQFIEKVIKNEDLREIVDAFTKLRLKLNCICCIDFASR